MRHNSNQFVRDRMIVRVTLQYMIATYFPFPPATISSTSIFIETTKPQTFFFLASL